MLKAVLAAATALTLAGSTLAVAQSGDRPRDGQRRFQPTTEDIRAFQAARLAALRAGLVLNAEQEKHWPAFEAAVREIQKMRLNRISTARETRRDGRQKLDPAERLRRHATRMTEAGGALKTLADATEPLYRSLDDGQRRRFTILARMMGPRGGHAGRYWRGRDGDAGGESRHPRQRRTDAVPGKIGGGIAVSEITVSRKQVDATPAALTLARKAVGNAPVELSVARMPVDGTAEPALARKPLTISYKTTGINRKANGFNRKPSGHQQTLSGEGL